MGRTLRHPMYAATGAFYLGTAAPAWGLLLAGRLLEHRDPYLLLSLGAILPAGLFGGIGFGRLPRTPRTDIAVRIAFLALCAVVILAASLLAVAAGAEALLTAARFSAMAASYLTLVSVVLLVRALLLASRDRASGIGTE
jgi:hypothetical protein